PFPEMAMPLVSHLSGPIPVRGRIHNACRKRCRNAARNARGCLLPATVVRLGLAARHRMRYTVATWAMVSDPGRNAASIRVRPAAARNPNCNVPLVPWHAVIRLLPYLRLQSAARRVGYGFEERLQGSDRM